MSHPSQTDFNNMSALLTGFNINVIAPAVDPIGLPKLFFDNALARTDGICAQLLDTFAALSAQTPPLSTDTIGQVLLGVVPDPATGNTISNSQTLVAQAIMKLWYLGSWYQPFNVATADAGQETVISDQAYIKGLAWQSMQSHAMGNSTFTFGYWDKPPAASLQDTTGNTDVSENTQPNTTGWGTGA